MPGSSVLDDAARIEEVSGLARAGSIEELMGRLSEPSWMVRRAVVACLARLGSSVPLLCDVLLGDRTDEARLAATVEALCGSIGDADDAVLRLLGDGHLPAVQCDAAQILGRRRCARAVPGLTRLMVGGDDNIASAAVEALGRIGGAAAVDALIVAVESRSFFRTFPAISPLGRSNDPRAVPPLVTLLAIPRYAPEAAEALGHSAHPGATSPLVALLVDADDALVRAAVHALARLRVHHQARFDEAFHAATADAAFAATARGRLRACSNGARADDKVVLSLVLGWLSDDAANGELLEAIREGDSTQRLRLLSLLEPTAACLPVFVACLDDADARVRAYACRALAKVGDTSVVPALFGLIGDANAYVAQASVAAIEALRCPETKALALEAAASKDPTRRRAALQIIGNLGFPEAVDLLTAAIGDPNERVRDTAIGGLASLRDPRAFAALLAASASAAAGARAAAMRALGRATGAAAAVALRAGIHDDDAWVRYYACQALGNLVVFEALDEVIGLIDDPAGQVRVAAIEAVAKLGDGRSTAVMDVACRSADPDIRRVAILGLGDCNRAEALPLLLREARSDDDASRLYALSALAGSDGDEATAALLYATSDHVAMVRDAAVALLLARSGAAATAWLIAQLGDVVRRDAALVALESPVDGRVEGIALALRDADSSLAPLLIAALATMASPASQAAIDGALTTDNVHARRSAARALTAAETPSSRALLDRAGRDDPDDEVRRICAAGQR